ncbi:MAG TPA: ion channel [Allosphingosinicella sp.]
MQPFWVFSPTWGLANVLKRRSDKKQRAAMIRRLNWIYFLASLGILGLTIALTGNDLAIIRPEKYGWWTAILHYILLWRFFEISYAFLRDAFDKLEKPESSSGLRWGDRVMLAMRSYVELVSNLALIYALFPRSAWLATDLPRPPSTVTDLVWYSANVITTSGDGGYIPGNILLKLFSIGEVFCGVILLVVSFTIYTSRALGGEPVAAATRGQVAR